MDCSLTRFLHPWEFPGKNTGVGCHFLLQEIFPTQGLNPGLLHCRQTLYHVRHQGRSSWGGQDRKGVAGKGSNKLQVVFFRGGDSWLNSEGWVRIYRQDRKSNLGRGNRKSLKFLSSFDKLLKGRGHVLLNFITLTLAQSLAKGRVYCWVNDGWMQRGEGSSFSVCRTSHCIPNGAWGSMYFSKLPRASSIRPSSDPMTKGNIWQQLLGCLRHTSLKRKVLFS